MQQCSWDQDHQICTDNVVTSALLLYRLKLKKLVVFPATLLLSD